MEEKEVEGVEETEGGGVGEGDEDGSRIASTLLPLGTNRVPSLARANACCTCTPVL